MVALIRLESVAAASARKPSWAISGARFGEIAENAPTTTPIEPKLAKHGILVQNEVIVFHQQHTKFHLD